MFENLGIFSLMEEVTEKTFRADEQFEVEAHQDYLGSEGAE